MDRHRELRTTYARGGRGAEARAHFAEARGNFAQIGADQDALAMDAALAECALYGGRAEDALAAADALLAKGGGVTAFAAALHRTRGEALRGLGDDERARGAGGERGGGAQA